MHTIQSSERVFSSSQIHLLYLSCLHPPGISWCIWTLITVSLVATFFLLISPPLLKYSIQRSLVQPSLGAPNSVPCLTDRSNETQTQSREGASPKSHRRPEAGLRPSASSAAYPNTPEFLLGNQSKPGTWALGRMQTFHQHTNEGNI